jgi:hypothetical protein
MNHLATFGILPNMLYHVFDSMPLASISASIFDSASPVLSTGVRIRRFRIFFHEVLFLRHKQSRFYQFQAHLRCIFYRGQTESLGE